MDNDKIFLYGNEKLKNFFNAATENGKLAHAYIFEGGRGSGKHTLARRLACLLACQSLFERPCMMCESCRKISEGISPDIIEIKLPNDKKSIGVEQLRELRSSVYVKPSEEDIKVYIISNAETMTVQAQNVFLKVLEEPPQGVYFIMLCENSSNILPTVKSRAPVLKMQIFSDEELKKYLLEYNKQASSLCDLNEDEFKLIVRIAEGKIGEAERLILDTKSDKSQSKHEKARGFIELTAEQTKYSDYLLYVQRMAKTKEELLDILLYAVYAVRDLMAVKKTTDDSIALMFYGDIGYARKIAANFTSAGVMNLYSELCRAREDLMSNLNLNNTLNYIACKFRSAASI